MRKPVSSTRTCPCCGAPDISDQVPPVWVDDVFAVRNNERVRLTPLEAELVDMLVKAYPGILYRDETWWPCSTHLIAHYMSKLRPALSRLDVQIVNVWRTGYVLQDSRRAADEPESSPETNTGPVSTGPVAL